MSTVTGGFVKPSHLLLFALFLAFGLSYLTSCLLSDIKPIFLRLTDHQPAFPRPWFHLHRTKPASPVVFTIIQGSPHILTLYKRSFGKKNKGVLKYPNTSSIRQVAVPDTLRQNWIIINQWTGLHKIRYLSKILFWYGLHNVEGPKGNIPPIKSTLPTLCGQSWVAWMNVRSALCPHHWQPANLNLPRLTEWSLFNWFSTQPAIGKPQKKTTLKVWDAVSNSVWEKITTWANKK